LLATIAALTLPRAKQFVNEGAYVFVIGRRETELTAAKKQIVKNVSAIQGDVIVGGIER
jgi:NADP-dependent 3-hydroxy acid dehydrogenase YdfG